ncbi:MAG: ABC transporter substrate-binding protein [Rhizobiales bacterium]|nr:ABC transporter substrate-binding protein [Hyphomicrobiales bacterium]
MLDRRQTLALLAGSAALGWSRHAFAQQKSQIVVSRQFGILYLPTHVIEKQGLIEKHAAKLGLSGITTNWVTLSGGGAQTDALLSGNVDLVNTGTGNLLLLWDRTRGGVKGIVASSAQPLVLITRNPKIKELKDYGPDDKIAVPTVKISTQAILLQMAAGKMYGADQWSKFDPNTVQLSHPDAAAALANPNHEVTSHFSAPPYQTYELKNVPGAHAVVDSTSIIGGPLTQGQFFTTTKFADANPKLVQAIRGAAEEARAFIQSNTKDAITIYKEVTGDKASIDDLADLLAQPGMMAWDLPPQGTMKFAQHLHKVGTLKTLPASWKDYYLPAAHDLVGS